MQDVCKIYQIPLFIEFVCKIIKGRLLKDYDLVIIQDRTEVPSSIFTG